MTRKEQRKGTNSVERNVDAYKNAGVVVELPEGLEFENEQEALIWQQFSRARSVQDWRDFDLVLLYKIVRTERDIRSYQAMLSSQGPVVENQRGTMVENPMIRVIDTLQRQQLAIIRSLSLTQTDTDPRTKNKSAKADAQALKTMEKHGAESLIAKPTH